MKPTLRAPFPWFGGKSKVAAIVWQRFGDVTNYVEPFFGSGAVLLGRPHWPWEGNRIETVNDADCYLANFWRALSADPAAVASFADWPVNEADLHARHWWLVNQAEFRGRMRADPEYHDAKIAGWWVWGLCQWIGSGWCKHPELEQLPHLGNAGRGVHRPSQQLPHLGSAGMGVHRPSQQRPHLGNAGMGINQPSQQLPSINLSGVCGSGARSDMSAYLGALSDRLHRVRVCCGDWSRVCGPTPTVKQGLTGVLLDPPYSAEAERDESLYAVESLTIAHDVRAWCIEMGPDPRIRIALCGYESEHDELEQIGWSVEAWKARGGYASQASAENVNARRERIWFSPHCLADDRHPLFQATEAT